MLFAADSPWVWDAERNFARLKENNSTLSYTPSRDIEDKGMTVEKVERTYSSY